MYTYKKYFCTCEVANQIMAAHFGPQWGPWRFPASLVCFLAFLAKWRNHASSPCFAVVFCRRMFLRVRRLRLLHQLRRCSRRGVVTGGADAASMLEVAAPPSGFATHHELGTGRCVVHKVSDGDEQVVVVCDVSPLRYCANRQDPSSSSSSPSPSKGPPVRSATRMVPKLQRRKVAPLSMDGSNLRLPVAFSVVVCSRSMTLDVSAASVCGTAVFDGAMFHATLENALERSLDAFGIVSRSYQGPILNQRGLAQSVCNDSDSSLNLLYPTRQQEFHRYCDALSTRSKFTKFDHLPVHTVPGSLYGALAAYLAALGIDDHFAKFMEVCSAKVQQEEINAWKERIQCVIAPRKVNGFS